MLPHVMNHEEYLTCQEIVMRYNLIRKEYKNLEG